MTTQNFILPKQRPAKHVKMAVISCVEMILLVLLKSILACEYKEFGMDHTMCSYTSTTCPILRIGFSELGKKQILRAHNELRQKVANGQQGEQPRASNMRELSWSDELAILAQTWANQCISGHDNNRRTKKFPSVGQNVYTFYSTSSLVKPKVIDAVTSWYDEVEKPGFDPNQIDPFQFSHSAGHYTQLMWSETKAIGCGYVYFNKFNMYTHHTVCNYGPGGNVLGEQMYQVGTPCAKCINGCSMKYPGLCGSITGTNRQIRNETIEDFKISGEKEDLKTMDVKEDLKTMDVKEDLKSMDVKEDLKTMGVKEDFIRSDVTEHFKRSDVTEHFRRSDETEHFKRSDETEHFKRSDETEHFKRSNVKEDFIRSDVKEDFEISDVKEDSNGTNEHFRLFMNKPIKLLNKFFEMFSHTKVKNVQLSRKKRFVRQADYYNSNSRNKDPIWKRAFNFVFRSYDGNGSNTQYGFTNY